MKQLEKSINSKGSGVFAPELFWYNRGQSFKNCGRAFFAYDDVRLQLMKNGG